MNKKNVMFFLDVFFANLLVWGSVLTIRLVYIWGWFPPPDIVENNLAVMFLLATTVAVTTTTLKVAGVWLGRKLLR